MSFRLALSKNTDISTAVSGESSMVPHNPIPHFWVKSSGLHNGFPMVTTHPLAEPLPELAARTPATPSRLDIELPESPRATTATPAALAVHSSVKGPGWIRPASITTAMSLSETSLSSSALSAKDSMISRVLDGFDGHGMTCRFVNKTSWEWSIRSPLRTGEPEATKEAAPGVNWMPMLRLIDPPAESASISSTSRPEEAQWAATWMAVVDAPGEPGTPYTTNTAFILRARHLILVLRGLRPTPARRSIRPASFHIRPAGPRG